MKKRLFVLFLVAFFWLTGCQSQSVQAQTAPEPIAAMPVVAAQPTKEVVDYCASCHTDKDALISTAKPEEIVEKESTGAG